MQVTEANKNLYNDYDDEPVVFCKHCLSLAIKDIDGAEYCDKCSSTSTEETSIQEWEEMFEQKYGYKYINKTPNKLWESILKAKAIAK